MCHAPSRCGSLSCPGFALGSTSPAGYDSAVTFARNMSTRGKQFGVVFALVLVFMLPKRVECGYPGAKCRRPASYGRTCVDKELEPFGFYLLELLFEDDVGFAYSVTEDCR